VAELAKHYGIARNTVMKALYRLSEDGLVEIVPNWERFGRGTKASGTTRWARQASELGCSEATPRPSGTVSTGL